MPAAHTGSVPVKSLLVILAVLLSTPYEGYAASPNKNLKPKAVKSLQQLRKLLENKGGYGYYGVLKTGVAPMVADSSSPAAMPLGSASEQVDYSTTNIQVEGVDEADTVKTDGRYIYSLQNNQVRIIEAYPANTLALLATLRFESGFSPLELFVEGDRLIVIGQGWRDLEEQSPVAKDGDSSGTGDMKMAYWYPRGESQTLTRIYNVANKTKPELEREIAFDGSYLSSRRIGKTVYLIGRKYPLFYPYIMPFMAEPLLEQATASLPVKAGKSDQPALPRNQIVPRIRDSRANKGKEAFLPMKKIFYFPGFDQANYIMVGSFQLDKPAQAIDFKSYLGAGDMVYASTGNLYISAADYSGASQQVVTHIYKFALEEGGTRFTDTGEVPGTPLNQFSLDENQGYFRIATTVNYWTEDGSNWQNKSWSNLYTLDAAMQVKGKLEHLAEGERMYSARFMGNRAYLVTFEQVDPLFVIDLSSPSEPKLLGELKIPGFSNYLHPYDENHLIGLGQDTVASTSGGLPLVKGVKLSLFDVTDPVNPEELHHLVLGGKGSYSPASHDHKAFWFDKKRKLLGFPIEETDASREYSADEWPQRIFQGAQVFDVSLEKGFTKKGAVTHLDDPSNNDDWYHYVQRLLTIGNELYTFSDTRLRVNSLKDFSLTGQLDFSPESLASE